MSSQDPPGPQGKHRVRSILRTGSNWVKGLARPSSTPPSSERQESLAIPTFGSRRLSFSRLIGSAPTSTNPAWRRLGSSLHAFESRLGVFLPLKSAVGALIGCLDVVQTAASDRADYERLANDFQSMADSLLQYASELESEPKNGSIANIVQCILRQVEDIKQLGERGTVGRLLDATHDQDDVIARYREIERLFRQLQCDLSMRTSRDVKEQLETTRLRGMFPVDDARYNSSYSTTIKRRACTAETREAIHQALQTWTTNSESERIYWMNGMAGTGKTTIAYSLCEWLEKTNRLGASFFCSRISSTCRSLNRIVPTFAYQLARYSPAFRSALYSALRDDPDAGALNVVQQFEKLVYQPMVNVKDAIPESVVVVIDALDECDDNYSVRLLLDLLLKYAEHLPLKFFVSSRPEPVIWDRMMTRGGSTRFIVYLHDIEQSIVEEDIKKYITEALSPMDPAPSPAKIELLAKRSRNLFIYAATVVRYIYPDDVSVDSSSRLESMLEAIGAAEGMSDNRYEDLDLLYTSVLTAVFKSRLSRDEKDHMRRVLWTVVSAREPITAATIATLASITERQAQSALKSLRSVVHVPENSSLISTLHASFPEYMLDGSRSKELCCNKSQSNETLTHRCLDVMKLELKFNICGLENSYLADDQVDDLEERVARCISPTLSYACRYWGSHLVLAPALDITCDMFLDFLSNRLLFWMEVLSLSRSIGIGAPMMQQAQTWLRIEDKRDEVQKQVSDARNFVTWFAANPCSRSTPHIYISALPLSAKSSWVYQHYFQRTKDLANISISQHDETVLAVWTTESELYSVAISPDGNRIASGSGDGSVRVYDMHTGAVVAGPFQGHLDDVNSVAFSHDAYGRHIASGSDDMTVIIWDADTGRVVTGPLNKHTDWVWSVAFSRDGKHLVSGSKDKTIIVWDVYTGAIVLGPLKGHSQMIYSVAFSPDGQLIASGSGDRTIRLWRASTGADVAEPLKGHTSSVYRVDFSPDGSRFASCSDDKTIRLWDVKAGNPVGLPFQGHKNAVRSLAFSHNSNWIVSGEFERDHNIIVWDALTGSVVLGPLSGHTNNVRSVAFTPDSTRIVSSSADQSIRIWDMRPEHRESGQQTAREHSFGPVAFSRDRTRLISSSSIGVLQIWDMHTCTTIPRSFEGQADVTKLHSIAVSPHDTVVAIGVDDFTIRVWSLLTGSVVPQLLRGHTDQVRCLTFSPDGHCLCSGSNDTTIMVWDVDVGAMVGNPYTGHAGAVVSVSYSPNARLLASGATDCTIRIWDLPAGTLIHTLDGHKSSVSSVMFSQDNVIVSGSIDGTTRQWEVRATSCSGVLFKVDSNSHQHPNMDSETNPGLGLGSDYDHGSDKATLINWVSESPDHTRIVSGFGSSIRLFDAQTAKPISKLTLPRGESIRWVGYSLNGTDLISVSVSEDSISQSLTEEPTQTSPQSSNIIRVWRAIVQHGQSTSSSTPRHWSYKPDGRVLSHEGLVMWIPPDLIPRMKQHATLGSDSHYNALVSSSEGFINIGYPDLCIGNRWSECYVHES